MLFHTVTCRAYLQSAVLSINALQFYLRGPVFLAEVYSYYYAGKFMALLGIISRSVKLQTRTSIAPLVWRGQTSSTLDWDWQCVKHHHGYRMSIRLY